MPDLLVGGAEDAKSEAGLHETRHDGEAQEHRGFQSRLGSKALGEKFAQGSRSDGQREGQRTTLKGDSIRRAPLCEDRRWQPKLDHVARSPFARDCHESGLVEIGLRLAVDHDARTPLGQQLCIGATDAPPRARDDGDAPVEAVLFQAFTGASSPRMPPRVPPIIAARSSAGRAPSSLAISSLLPRKVPSACG